MPDQRSVMKEYRYLDEKRLAEGLTPAEQARLEKLRVLVGPESGAGSIKPGFDVNAAAAALRESLLPAGLRNRPPPPPPAAPEPAPELEPEPEPAATLHDALATEYAESPFAPLETPAGQPQDALFDPSSLGTEPAPYDPNAQPYDPAAQPYDPDAYPADAAYDPNAPQQAWDPNQPWDPNAAPQDAAAYPADAAYDPNAPQAWDPNQPWDPNAAPAEAQPGEPGAYADAAYGAGEAQQAWDPNQPWDPNAAPQDAAYPADAASAPDAAPQAWDPNQPWDPNAAPEGATPAEAGGYADAAYGAGASAPQAWDAPAEPAADAAAEEVTDLSADELTEVEPIPGEAAPPEGGSFETGDAGAPAGWDAEPAPPAPAADPAFGEYDAAGGVEPFAPGTLGAEPPLDASAFGERLAQEAPPAIGAYDDTAGFAAEPFDASSVPPDAPGLDAPPAPELDAAWQPEAALDAGFELASGGSFGAGADAAAPEWAQSPAPPPWEGTPPLDLQAAPVDQVAEEETGYEISPAPASESFAPAHAADLFGAPDGDLAAPAEDGLAEGGAAPELDFSQPDFSGGAEPDAMEPQADLSGGSFALSAGTAAGTPEPVDLAGAPPLELGEAPAAAEGEAPAWDAAAPEAPLDLAAEPALPELPPPVEAPPIPELTAPPDETFLEASEVIEEVPAEEAAPDAAPEPAAEAMPADEAVQLDGAAPADDAGSFGEAAPGPADDVLQFAEAAAAAVASESTDLSEVIEAPPAVVGEAPPPVDDFALEVAEEAPAALGAGEPSFDAATALAGGGATETPPAPEDFVAPPEVAIALGAEEHAPLEHAADVDLSFDLSEEPAPAGEPQGAVGVEEPSPLEAALEAAPPAEAAPLAVDEEIPTIDGADILEEIVEDGAAAAPPQSLEFEPLEPEPPAAAPPAVVSAPPAPAPVAIAPPPAPVLAPPPPVVAAPAPVAAVAPPPAPPEPAPAGAPADYCVAGSHRVVVHTIEGLVKRGVLDDPALDAPALALAPQPGGAQEEVPAEKVKAIFFMLSPGEKAPAAEGKRVRVTFRDGRQIAGFSPDYREEGIGFFMIPADTKTNTGRIWVYRAAVRQVTVS